MKKIVVFASGSGTNAENIIKYFEGTDVAKVTYLLTNRADAYALKRADRLGVNTLVFDKQDIRSNKVLQFLLDCQPDLIVLAGFMLLVPEKIVQAFPNRIVNIHPALLPAYGGKGMYGDNVHRSVIENGEKQSGITIHFVNERYDEGSIIFQAKCDVSPNDDADSLAEKIHQLEYKYYPRMIEELLQR